MLLRRLPGFLIVLCVFSMCRKHTQEDVRISVPVINRSYMLVGDTQTVNDAFGGYYIALPARYNRNTTKYPLLIFLHGLGQRGDGKKHLPYLLFDGIGKVIHDNRLPVYFTVKGEKLSFIIVSPQYQRQPNVDEVMELTEHIQAKYRVKSNRIYLSGLSLGSRIATLVAAERPEKFAALVPIAGVATNEGMNERCKKIADANLPVWAFHNADDPMSNVEDAQRFINYLDTYSPFTPRFTVFDKYGHDAWTSALDTAYREDGKNMYEWMLQYHR
jgi:predicted peptidase